MLVKKVVNKFVRLKFYCNIGTIGHVDYEKITLTFAFKRYVSSNVNKGNGTESGGFFSWIYDFLNYYVVSWFAKKSNQNEQHNDNIPKEQKSTNEQNIVINNQQIVPIYDSIDKSSSKAHQLDLMISEYIETGKITYRKVFELNPLRSVKNNDYLLVWSPDKINYFGRDFDRSSVTPLSKIFENASKFKEAMISNESNNKKERAYKVWAWLNEQKYILNNSRNEISAKITVKCANLWTWLDPRFRELLLIVDVDTPNKEDFPLFVGKAKPVFRGLCGEIYLLKKDIQTANLIEDFYDAMLIKHCDPVVIAEELRLHGIFEVNNNDIQTLYDSIDQRFQEENNFIVDTFYNNNNNNMLLQIYSFILNEVPALDYTWLLQSYKFILDNKLFIKWSLTSPIKEKELYIKSFIINANYNVLEDFNLLKQIDENWKTLDNICYSIAFSNVLIEYINKELTLCNDKPELIFKKYSKFGNVISIKLNLSKIMAIYIMKKMCLEDFLISMIKKNLKKRSIILIIFMSLWKLVKKGIMSIISKIKPWIPPGSAVGGLLLILTGVVLVVITTKQSDCLGPVEQVILTPMKI